MFNAKDYHALTPNSRLAIAKLEGFYCPVDCKCCPFYCNELITVNYIISGVPYTHEGHCIINSARVEFPYWRKPYTKQEV